MTRDGSHRTICWFLPSCWFLRSLLVEPQQPQRDPLVACSALLPCPDIRFLAITAEPFRFANDDKSLVPSCSLQPLYSDTKPQCFYDPFE